MSLFDFFKKKPAAQEQPVITNEPATLIAKLLFTQPPTLDITKLNQELALQFTSFHTSEQTSSLAGQFFFSDYKAEFKEGVMPAQCVYLIPSNEFDAKTSLAGAWQQLWHWREGKEETENCRFVVFANDLFALTLPHQQRVEMFQKFLYALTKTLTPVALYFPTSEKVVSSEDYINQFDLIGAQNLFGLVNVRMYNVPEDKSIIMDSVGLHVLSLPDFQMQFKEYEASDIAGLLHSYTHYIFQNGSVILHGNTVEGVEEGSRWECLYNKSVLKPERNVLTLNPLPTE